MGTPVGRPRVTLLSSHPDGGRVPTHPSSLYRTPRNPFVGPYVGESRKGVLVREG